MAGVTWEWRDAVRERVRAEGVAEFLTLRLFARADDELNIYGRNPTVRDLLDGIDATLGNWLDGQPDVEAQVRQTIGGAVPVARRLADGGEAAPQGDRSWMRGRTARRDASASAPATCWRRCSTGPAARSSAEPMLRRNLADCRRVFGPDDPTTLDGDERLGSVLWHLGRLDEAEAVLRKNVDDRGRVFKPDHADTLRSVYLLSRLLRERRRFGEARDLAYRYAHDIQCARGTNHPDRIVALTNQGDVARDQGHRDEAERYYRQASIEAGRILGPEHKATRAAEANLARFLRKGQAGARGPPPASRRPPAIGVSCRDEAE